VFFVVKDCLKYTFDNVIETSALFV